MLNLELQLDALSWTQSYAIRFDLDFALRQLYCMIIARDGLWNYLLSTVFSALSFTSLNRASSGTSVAFDWFFPLCDASRHLCGSTSFTTSQWSLSCVRLSYYWTLKSLSWPFRWTKWAQNSCYPSYSYQKMPVSWHYVSNCEAIGQRHFCVNLVPFINCPVIL